MTEASRPPVVLLHGLGRTARSMTGLGRRLEAAGYRTWARSYPSRKQSIPELADTVADWILADLGEVPLMAVTHSMGGIVLRHLADRFDWQRAVMLAPPNQGSMVASGLRDWWTFKTLYGPAGQQVADGSEWPDPAGDVGVIAGVKGATWNNPTSWLIAGLKLLPDQPHDGTVARDETQADWAVDFAEVDATHTWIMNHPRTTELVLRFLDGGAFDSPENAV